MHFVDGFGGFMVVDVVSILAPPRCKRGGASFGSSQQHYGRQFHTFSDGFGGLFVVDVVSILAPPLCQRGGASFGSSQQRHGDLTAGCWLIEGWLSADGWLTAG